MNNKIDMSYISQHTPSLCIPRLFNNVTEETIRITFNNLKLGIIHKIDVTSKTNKNGDSFKRAFIHFKKWNIDERTNVIRENFILGKEIKIIYDDPWFWKVSAYRPPIFNSNSHNINPNNTNSHNTNPNNIPKYNSYQIMEIKLPKTPCSSPPQSMNKKISL